MSKKHNAIYLAIVLFLVSGIFGMAGYIVGISTMAARPPGVPAAQVQPDCKYQSLAYYQAGSWPAGYGGIKASPAEYAGYCVSAMWVGTMTNGSISLPDDGVIAVVYTVHKADGNTERAVTLTGGSAQIAPYKGNGSTIISIEPSAVYIFTAPDVTVTTKPDKAELWGMFPDARVFRADASFGKAWYLCSSGTIADAVFTVDAGRSC